jgi:hypothetical protein
MNKVEIHVWHNVNGRIVAVGRPIGAAKCIPLSSGDHSVLETEIEEEHIPRLHQTHIVDVAQKALVHRSDRKKSP